jgi:hypothetical protein
MAARGGKTMNFDKWIDAHPAKDSLTEVEIGNLRVAWNVVVGEAVRISKSHASELRNTGLVIANEIETL